MMTVRISLTTVKSSRRPFRTGMAASTKLGMAVKTALTKASMTTSMSTSMAAAAAVVVAAAAAAGRQQVGRFSTE